MESARHPEPQSGAALTATAGAVACARAAQRRTLARATIIAMALGTMFTLAGTLANDRVHAAAPAGGTATFARTVDRHLDTTPPRTPTGLEVIRNGWAYNCMECHTLLGARWRYDRPLNEHQGITLEHGNNRYCLNCHHPANRNAFADYDGAEIAQTQVVELCAKCHGTIYRDWQAGVHGRQNGYWRAQAGRRTNLRCIECHDPHRPKFSEMKPLAPLRYPPRAAGARAEAPVGVRVSSFEFRVSGSPGILATMERRNRSSEPGTDFNPKPATRNPKPPVAARAKSALR